MASGPAPPSVGPVVVARVMSDPAFFYRNANPDAPSRRRKKPSRREKLETFKPDFDVVAKGPNSLASISSAFTPAPPPSPPRCSRRRTTRRSGTSCTKDDATIEVVFVYAHIETETTAGRRLLRAVLRDELVAAGEGGEVEGSGGVWDRAGGDEDLVL